MEFILILLLILLNGFFAMSEIAILSSKKNRLLQWAKTGSKQADMALKLAQEPNNFLSSIQVGITLISISAGALGEGILGAPIRPFIESLPVVGPYHETLTFVLVITVITYLSLIFGELVPKRIALSNPERIAMVIAPFMVRFAKVVNPVVNVLSRSTETMMRVFGIKSVMNSSVTEEEVKGLISEGTEIGLFNKTEKDLVERALKLDDLKVIALMTPRNNIKWFDIERFTDNPEKYLAKYDHSRIFFCDGTLDKLVGIIHVKDLFQKYVKDRKMDIKSLVKKPLFVPTSMKALRVLELFRDSPTHIAMVVDEYGNIQGIVTFNDILQALVGDMEERKQNIDPDIVKRNDGSLILDGMLAINEFKKIVHIAKLPKEDHATYQTLGGFILSYLEHIPVTGARFKWHNFHFEIVDIENQRVNKVIVTPIKSEK